MRSEPQDDQCGVQPFKSSSAQTMEHCRATLTTDVIQRRGATAAVATAAPRPADRPTPCTSEALQGRCAAACRRPPRFEAVPRGLSCRSDACQPAQECLHIQSYTQRPSISPNSIHHATMQTHPMIDIDIKRAVSNPSSVYVARPLIAESLVTTW